MVNRPALHRQVGKVPDDQKPRDRMKGLLISPSLYGRYSLTKHISSFPINPLPLRWGRVRVGADKSDSVHN
jgi:hypothetical protein